MELRGSTATVHRHSRGDFTWKFADRSVSKVDLHLRGDFRMGTYPLRAPLPPVWHRTHFHLRGGEVHLHSRGDFPGALVWEVEVHPCVDSPARLAARDVRTSNLPLGVAAHFWKSITLPAKPCLGVGTFRIPRRFLRFRSPAHTLRCGALASWGDLGSLRGASSRGSLAFLRCHRPRSTPICMRVFVGRRAVEGHSDVDPPVYLSVRAAMCPHLREG